MIVDALIKIAKNVVNINEDFIIKQLFKDSNFKKFILSRNIYSQLFDEGIDSAGKKLRSDFATFGQVYSANTINIKQDKGQPVDRVTLFDTGAFYASFRLELEGKNFIINANTIKEDSDLIEVWGPDILGLTNESLELVITLAREIIIPIIYDRIFKGV